MARATDVSALGMESKVATPVDFQRRERVEEAAAAAVASIATVAAGRL